MTTHSEMYALFTYIGVDGNVAGLQHILDTHGDWRSEHGATILLFAIDFLPYWKYRNVPTNVCETAMETVVAHAVRHNYIDVGNWKGWTALHCAIYGGQANWVRCLMRHGANPDLPNHVGDTARQYSKAWFAINEMETIISQPNSNIQN